MSWIEGVLSQRKLVLSLSALLALLGLASWLTMTRQEDPRLPDYWGQVVVTFPGADAMTVERLVLEPLEDHLGQVDEIKEINSTANAEVAVLEIELTDRSTAVEEAWDRVREALTDARAELPAGVSEPALNDRVFDQTAIVYALRGVMDPLALAQAAEVLEDELLGVPGVSRVEILADPREQLTIELDDSVARRLGLTPGEVAAQLAARTQILPGGSLSVAGRAVRLRPATDFQSLEEIQAAPLVLPSGESVPLSTIARVRRGPEEPARAYLRHNGERVVGVAVVPRRDLHLVRFGEALRAKLQEVAPRLAPVEVQEIVYQPARVAARLSGLSRSLLSGALIVAGVLVTFMGLRLGLLVSSIVPLVTLSSLAVFALGGGVLHQISIAAVVIALGMLVDNAVVVTESIQHYLDEGLTAGPAAVAAVRELAVPLAGATGTTVAAFVPMLLAPGVTAQFTRAIPIMILLTLVMSYGFALLVTPVLSARFLRGRREARATWMDRLGGWAGRVAVGRPLTVIAWSAAAVVASFLAAQAVRQEFFSESDRNQLVIDLKLPEGSHLDATDRTSERLEEALAERPEVTGVTAFLGRSAPRFYYNISQVPWSPHFGQLVVDTTSTEVLEELAAFIRGFARDELPGTEVVVRKLEQGPPVAAPVEVRLYGASLPDLHQGAERVMALLRQTPGTTDVRHDLSLGTPALVFTIDDAAAARRGLARTDVASALFRTTRGMAVGWYRAGNDPVPVVLRSAAGEDFPLAELPSLDVTGAGGEPVPLAQLARLSPEWVPGAVRHRDRRRAVLVSSQLLPGFTYSQVVDALAPRLPEIALPAGITAELGGTAQSSGEANEALLRTLPAGLLLLLGILLAEFRSFRRVGLVLLTVPLAAVGVVPGLLLGDQPFGFMSLLGIMALAGVVVNNAIVLLEVVEARRRDGADVPTALADAVARRVRPIFLTTATTVLGLFPLAFSDSTLWPPLAWSMISGLTASTLLTLLVIPACYLLLFDPGRLRWRGAVRRRRAAPAAGVLLLLSLGVDAVAEVSPPLPVVTWQEALAGAGLRPRVAAETERAAALAHRAEAVRREARWPTVAGGAEVVERSLEPEIDTPVGRFRFGDSRLESASLTLIQPLLEPAARWFRAPAASTQAEAGELLAERAAEVAVAEAAEAYLDALAVEARITATRAFVASLETALAETETRVAHGRTLEVDALKVRLTLDSARQDLLRLGELSQVSALALGQAVGLATPARPAGPVPGEPSAPASFEAAWALALEQRTELRSLALEREAAVLSRKALTADALPRLEATVSGIYSTGNPFDDTEWVEGGVRLSWRPFAAGTRGPRRDALAQEEAALAATEAEARRSIALELRAALADWTVARSALAVATTGIAQATETLRVEQERHRAGRITTNDLLAAEAALRDQQTLRDLAALDLVRARVRYDLALGQAPAVGR